MRRLRVAAIDFLNPAPLMWDFDHEPESSLLRERYAVETMTPAECAARLHSGDADLGLVPITACATTPGLLIAPGSTIASKGAIRSILLVVKSALGLNGVRTIAADTSSRASLAYTQILFRRFWRNEPAFVPHAPDLDAMLQKADAALLIGDPALLALEARAARASRTGEGLDYQALDYVDLGTEWRRATGMPWVSAVWAVRSEAVAESPALRQQLVRDLQASRDRGLAHREDLVREWTARISLPESTIRAYLNQNIHYVLDEDCLAGIRHFFALAAECGVLPAAPPLRLIEG